MKCPFKARLNHRSPWYKNNRTLSEECGEIFYYHQSVYNQILHIITSSLSFCGIYILVLRLAQLCFIGSDYMPFAAMLTVPALFFAYYFYLDPVIAFFWSPIFAFMSFLAYYWNNLYIDAIHCCGGEVTRLLVVIVITLINMLLQLLGHFIFEKIPPVLNKIDLFEFMIMTPFTLAYYCLGWISGGRIRRQTMEIMKQSFPQPTTAQSLKATF